ncbi:MAG: hypothetical protein Q8R15_01085 [Candidatus Micrarchaeota archaeon]|nr:hypothetical protein [Candidatus Micrarchaeota archaeon]
MFLLFLFLQADNVVATNSLIDRAVVTVASNLLDEVATVIDLAGHSTALSAQFSTPPFLPGGFNYVFGVSNTSVYISWNATGGLRSVQRQITAFNVTNSSGAPFFYLSPGQHFATKLQRGVRIT